MPFESMTFVGRYVRVLPQTNSESSYQHKMRFELHGCTHPRNSAEPSRSKFIPSQRLWFEAFIVSFNYTGCTQTETYCYN